MRIICDSDHKTIRFAAEELARCLSRMAGRKIAVETSDSNSDGVRVGLMDVEATQDPRFDDAIDIEVRNGSGRIAGVNPRSALLGVYRYLTELGCRWVRPGADGEYIPKLESLPDVLLRETAAYRHRGICIEGSVSADQLDDLVAWMPKVGFNAYFTQFREAYTFFDRWHGQCDDPSAPAGTMPVEDARKMIASLVEELRKRDLLYHAVGHGWTCEPFGISGLGWYAAEGDLPEETTQLFALVNGERKLWGGVGINTNLCYSNPKARDKVVREIANYLKAHPEVDVLHFWLADGSNNNCECDECRKARPSDFYVQMLNSLDELMTAEGLDARIVFLIYVDLLWPPLKEKIRNPDRFILMFAPITRNYDKAFVTDVRAGELPPFETNKLEFPSSVEQNIAFLKAWQKDFRGDSFDFDYHLLWAHNRDAGGMAIARVICDDTKALKDIGLNGFVSCQVQRAFFPTGLPMTALGRGLWSRDCDFDKLAADYFKAAYGPEAAAARRYLDELSELFDQAYLRGEKPKENPESAEQFARAAAAIDAFAPTIERNIGLDNQCWAKSWSYLKLHAGMAKLLAGAFESRARGKDDAKAGWERVKEYLSEKHDEVSPVFDTYLFIGVMGGFFA